MDGSQSGSFSKTTRHLGLTLPIVLPMGRFSLLCRVPHARKLRSLGLPVVRVVLLSDKTSRGFWDADARKSHSCFGEHRHGSIR